jgi:hypothetical protein
MLYRTKACTATTRAANTTPQQYCTVRACHLTDPHAKHRCTRPNNFVLLQHALPTQHTNNTVQKCMPPIWSCPMCNCTYYAPLHNTNLCAATTGTANAAHQQHVSCIPYRTCYCTCSAMMQAHKHPAATTSPANTTRPHHVLCMQRICPTQGTHHPQRTPIGPDAQLQLKSSTLRKLPVYAPRPSIACMAWWHQHTQQGRQKLAHVMCACACIDMGKHQQTNTCKCTCLRSVPEPHQCTRL